MQLIAARWLHPFTKTRWWNSKHMLQRADEHPTKTRRICALVAGMPAEECHAGCAPALLHVGGPCCHPRAAAGSRQAHFPRPLQLPLLSQLVAERLRMQKICNTKLIRARACCRLQQQACTHCLCRAAHAGPRPWQRTQIGKQSLSVPQQATAAPTTCTAGSRRCTAAATRRQALKRAGHTHSPVQ